MKMSIEEPTNRTDVYQERNKSELVNPDRPSCQIATNIKFLKSSSEDLENFGPDYRSVIDTVTEEKFVVHIKPKSEEFYINNNLKLIHYLKNKNITSVLENRSHEIKDNKHVYLFYKFYKCTLRNHIGQGLLEENFMYLLTKLFNAIDLVHSVGIAIGNISLDNVAIVEENHKLKPKVFNLSLARFTTDHEAYLKDKKDVAILILSIIVGDAEARVIADQFTSCNLRDEKFDLIYERVKDVRWIHKTNMKMFADLIACLLNVKSEDSLKEFKKHPFFYTCEKILQFMSAINGRLNRSQDAKSKDLSKANDVKNRNKVMNKLMPENPEIYRKLKEALGDFAPKNATLAERSREARNKQVHLEDDTDVESDSEDENQSHNPTQNINAIKNLSKKKSESCKMVSKFFRNNGGPIKFYLEVDEHFIYDLFNCVRILAHNPNIKKFYINSFLFEDSKTKFEKILKEVEEAESAPLAKKIEVDDSLEKSPNKPANVAPKQEKPEISSDARNKNIREQENTKEKVKNQSAKNKKDNKQETNRPTGAVERHHSTASNHSQQSLRTPKELKSHPNVGYKGNDNRYNIHVSPYNNQNIGTPSPSYQSINYNNSPNGWNYYAPSPAQGQHESYRPNQSRAEERNKRIGRQNAR